MKPEEFTISYQQAIIISDALRFLAQWDKVGRLYYILEQFITDYQTEKTKNNYITVKID